jgi:3-dehydroquinate synthase
VPSVRVNTPQAQYDVHIGSNLLRTLYPRLKKLTAPKPLRAFVVTSPEIWALWHERFLASFPADQQPTALFLPPGERHKRFAQVEALAEQLVHAGADRDSILLAFGGGIIGDLTGFLAAIYMRGIHYVGIPTTLLAQVDSSLGGKTGVNLTAGKNLIGSFHHPLTVISDIDTLRTLPPAELRAGLQEAVKASIIYDPRLFAYMEKNADAILGTGPHAKIGRGGIEHRPSKPGVVGPDPAALTRVVTASVKVKADVVSKDEKESGLRMILNFGHTIGHAIEAATNYRKLLHGEAVAWGSIAALHVSLNRGRITQAQFDRMAACILRYGPIPPFKADPAKVVALTYGDKKKRSGRRAYVLTTGIGTTEIAYDITDAELLVATQAMLANMRQQLSR